MYQIRRGVFETNSSSCHSIAIQKDPPDIKNRTVFFGLDEFGWENGCADPCDYLWTAVCELYGDRGFEDEIDWWKNQIAALGKELNNECRFATEKNDYEYCYIDHCGELYPLLDELRENKDKLSRFVFGNKSCVYTGNDNSDDQHNMCYCADSTIESYNYDKEDWESIPNENHNEDEFEYYFKGN